MILTVSAAFGSVNSTAAEIIDPGVSRCVPIIIKFKMPIESGGPFDIAGALLVASDKRVGDGGNIDGDWTPMGVAAVTEIIVDKDWPFKDALIVPSSVVLAIRD